MSIIHPSHSDNPVVVRQFRSLDMLDLLLAIMLLDLKWFIDFADDKVIRFGCSDSLEVIANAALAVEVLQDLFYPVCRPIPLAIEPT